MKLPAHGRYDYAPIHKRPQYEWPEGARLAVTRSLAVLPCDDLTAGAAPGADEPTYKYGPQALPPAEPFNPGVCRGC